jgi:FKBP-type peptidyl-prolyl cis-trans isomerase SlyD
MQIESMKVVTIEYTLTDEEGEVLDTSDGGEPLSYIHGTGSIIPGLESALEGKNPGDAVSVKVPAADAYGERDDSLVQALPRAMFPPGQVEVGMQFHAQSTEGARIVTVVAADEGSVTIDANHPLAGMNLSFEVRVVEVREPTAEELSHGHVHGAGGHHHH